MCESVKSSRSSWTSSRAWAALVAALAAACVRAEAGALLDSANHAFTQGKLADAARLYRRGALQGENPGVCYFNCANAYFQMDSVPLAIVYYRSCVSIAPDFFRARYNLAIAYFNVDDMANCIAEAKDGLRLDPQNDKLRLVLATSLRKAGAISEAIVEYERLTESNPEMEAPYVALGELYHELADDDQALGWLQRSPPSGQNGAHVNALMADICEGRGDNTRALYYLRQLESLGESSEWVVYRMVVLLSKTGNDLVALETAREGMERFPNSPDLALEGGNLAFRSARLGEAELCYTQALRLGSPGAVVGLENVRVARGKEQVAGGAQ